VLEGMPPFEARITGIDRFERPTRGSGPVLYFAIESKGIDRVHRRLVEEFGAVADLEGEAYTPHVTLARGGSLAAARELVGDVEPIEWTVSELRFYDPRYRETVGRVPLPG
jgi:2'-5' RNA ligase